MSTCTHSWQANRRMKCPPTHVDVPPADAKQVQRSMLSACLGLALSYICPASYHRKRGIEGLQ